MRIDEVLTKDQDIEEWKASKKLCKSKRSDSSLGASALASCKSQGLRKRKTKVLYKLNPRKKRENVTGRAIKGDEYGGPIK